MFGKVCSRPGSCQRAFHLKGFNVRILSSAGERTVGSRGLRGEIIGLRILKLWKEARKRSKERIIPRPGRDAVFLARWRKEERTQEYLEEPTCGSLWTTHVDDEGWHE